jgi:glycosyltransferase involved in cell wall biosynthesis
MNRLDYALITPARNEEQFIGATIEGVARQTVLPLAWVIVSDGSTDRTDEIVRQFSGRLPWLHLLRLPERTGRDFGGKVRAFAAGFAHVEALQTELLGNLDADTSLPPQYFEYLGAQFAGNPRLGIAGTPFIENGRKYDFRFASPEHVSGQAQLFRTACYKEIGGYQPSRLGGIDVIACLAARMHGWETRTFMEHPYTHHRTMGTATTTRIGANFRLGQKDYAVGRHPLWQLSRSIYQFRRRPPVLGGLLLLSGYCWAAMRRVPRPVSAELIAFQRSDQMRRLRRIIGLRS